MEQEAAANLAALPPTPRDFVRDPVLLEFLGLPQTGKLLEADLEQALLDNLQAFLLELDNPTVGVILCAQKDTSVVHYSVLHENAHLFASKYKLVLPTEEELRAELDRERALLAEMGHGSA